MKKDKTMMAVRKLKPEPGLDYVEIKVPTPGKGEVLIKVAGVGIDGSDRHILNWEGGQSPKTNPPVTSGHEIGGTVIELGEGADSKWLNQDIMLESVIREKDWYLGINFNGGLAPYLVVPQEALYEAPKDFPLELAGGLEPATTGFQAARKAKEQIEIKKIDNPTVVVLGGTGMIGAAAALASSFYGYKTYAVGRRDSVHKLNKIDSKIITVNTKEQSLEDALKGEEPQIVIETVGVPVSFLQALKTVALGGVIVDIGLHEVSEKRAEGDLKALVEAHNLIVRKELTLRGVYARGPEDWGFATKNIGTSNGKIDITSLMVKRPISEFKEALEDKGDGFKTILIP